LLGDRIEHELTNIHVPLNPFEIFISDYITQHEENRFVCNGSVLIS